MISDPLTWSPINLGRWSGTKSGSISLLIVFVVFRLLADGALAPGHAVDCRPSVLAGAAAGPGGPRAGPRPDGQVAGLRTRGGAALAAREHGRAGRVAVGRQRLVALAGPVTSAAIVLVTAIGRELRRRPDHLEPVRQRRETRPHPWLPSGTQAAPLTPLWWFGWFGYLNWVLLLANLIPALPFDGGRMLRCLPGQHAVVSAKDNMLAPGPHTPAPCVLG